MRWCTTSVVVLLFMIPIFIASIAFGGTGFKYVSYASSTCDLNKSTNTYICGCSYIRSDAPCEGQEMYYYGNYDKYTPKNTYCCRSCTKSQRRGRQSECVEYTYGICPPTNCNSLCNQGGATIINNKTMYVTKFTTSIDNYTPKCLIKKGDIPTAYIGGYSKKNIAIFLVIMASLLGVTLINCCLSICACNNDEKQDTEPRL